VFTVRLTVEFQAWLDDLGDKRAQVRIAARLRQAEGGNLGDWASVRGELSEMRVHFGPGSSCWPAGQVIADPRHPAGAAHRRRAWRRAMKKKTAKPRRKLLAFDATRYLTDDAAVAEYMTAVLETGDADLLLMALGDVARARGMAQVAKDTGLGRESLYKALAPGAKPRFDTVLKVARALGVKLTARPS
jgi:probable addiction module antidote protein